MNYHGATVAIVGHSVCPGNSALDGPALWTARIENGRVAEWRVYEDSAENRVRLGHHGVGPRAEAVRSARLPRSSHSAADPG